MKNRTNLLLLVSMLVMIPTLAFAFSYSTTATHTDPTGKNNFEIEVYGPYFVPDNFNLPQGYGWAHESMFDSDQEITIVTFHGESMLPPDIEFTFGVEDIELHGPANVGKVYWTRYEQESQLPQTGVTLDLGAGPDYEVTVTLANDDLHKSISLLSVMYTKSDLPFALSDLNCISLPPVEPTMIQSSVPPLSEIGPGGIVTFTVNLLDETRDAPDRYLVIYLATWWVDPNARDYNDTGSVSYLQFHTSEMPTPVQVKTWSNLKGSYE
ncbi:hypothetical protein H8E52_11295 [bacterium]|nr:hypothetical protein [bacterium]